jgi:hypothetical protein
MDEFFSREKLNELNQVNDQKLNELNKLNQVNNKQKIISDFDREIEMENFSRFLNRVGRR